MISATDSFIQYLSAGLAGIVPVAWVRASALDATTSDFQIDSVNVSILTFDNYGTYEESLISVDIIGSDERTVLDWTKRTRDLLIERQYTPELDYEANPATPVATGRMVSWDGREVDFHVVRSQARYVHVNATFPLSHVR